MSTSTVAHPARYGDNLLDVFRQELKGYANVLDPMAGTGRIHELGPNEWFTFGMEIQPQYCNQQGDLHAYKTTQGDSSKRCGIPAPGGWFHAVCCSPDYGNRFADSHTAQDASSRSGYLHTLRKATGDPNLQLEPNNGGRFYFWQPGYRDIHWKIWVESVRVLKPAGRFVLNTKNFYRGKTLVDVTAWHVDVLEHLGLRVVKRIEVPSPGLKYGANRERVKCEDVTVLEKRT